MCINGNLFMNRSRSNSTRPILLAVFAHPDDESFGPGGTLAKYAAEGAIVHVVIATDGNAGSVEENQYNPNGQSLSQVRATELSNAAVELGITTIWSLPYRDSGMRGSPENQHSEALIQQPIEQLTAEISEYITRLRPHVVMTHDPFGGYGHPDHVRCCEAVTAAFYSQYGHQFQVTPHESPGSTVDFALNENVSFDHNSGVGVQKLYYTAFDKRILKLIVQIMPLFGQDPTAIGRNKDIDLVEISHWETPVHAAIDVSQYLTQKEAASRAHASQYSGGPAFLRALPSFIRKRFLAKESFTRAFPAPTGELESDLFSNIEILQRW